MELIGNLYEVFRNTIDIHDFIKKFPFEEVKEYFDSLNQDVDYRYFVCLLEKDFSYAIKYYQNNKDFMHALTLVSSSICSMFGYAKYDSIDIIFRYLNNNKDDLKLFKAINNFDSAELYKYVRLSNDNELICKLLNSNSRLYEKFVMEDERAIYFINNHMINIRLVKYPEHLKNNVNIFESLKDYSIAQTRENINKYSEINKIYSVQEKFEKYEDGLINKFNPNTKEFEVEETDKFLQTYTLLDQQKIERERKFNELIIDRLFRDNYNNIIINIKEVLRYANKSNIISSEDIELYNKIINFKELSYKDKMDIYNKYKDKRLYTKFYLDILNCKKELYKDIKDNLYVPNNLDKELSDKYDVDVYYLNGENFSMLVRTLNDRYTSGRHQERECFSLINNDNTSKYNGDYVYGYNDFDTERIISINEYDAYSSIDGETDFPNRLMTVDELAGKQNYNEVQIKTGNIPVRPSYVVAFNEIKENDVYESKRLDIPLVLINEQAYNKKELSGNMFENRERYADGYNYEYRGHTL